MKQGTYEILRNIEITSDIYEMMVYCPEMAAKAEPGQFVHIRPGKRMEPLLRRPISINKIDREKGTLTLVYQIVGQGTAMMAELKAGEKVDVMGPIGKGFPVIEGKKCALVGGGIGIAPLLELASRLDSCEAFLGYRCEPYQLAEFQSYAKAVHIATDDGSCGHKGFVTDLIASKIKEFDVVYTCGPKIMMSKVKDICTKAGVECYVSVEERMGCGIGACLVCACKTKYKDEDWRYRKACIDGPVFKAEEVDFND